MNENERKIYKYALSFREAINKAIDNGEFKGCLLKDFPRGCCAVASDLLQRFLLDRKIKTYCIFGEFGYGPKGESHVWLQTENGIVIDITGDQYAFNKQLEFSSQVYVGPLEDGFHNLFNITDSIEYTPNNDPFIKKTKNEIAYETVLKYIND